MRKRLRCGFIYTSGEDHKKQKTEHLTELERSHKLFMMTCEYRPLPDVEHKKLPYVKVPFSDKLMRITEEEAKAHSTIVIWK